MSIKYIHYSFETIFRSNITNIEQDVDDIENIIQVNYCFETRKYI